jgi:poly(A) polymerase
MEPVVVPRPQHNLSRKLIDPEALKVMYRLLRGGYRAYLVGGAVRDLLLGRTPKDFDVGTDAHPHKVKKLFRNCRLVGRRFRLAHVHFGEKIVEVSTFRRLQDEDASGDRLIRSDNTFGTPEEDAVRRDFTINGLFYDLETFAVLDYVGGIEDLESRTIRSIGDPNVRIPEDPVRILRAIKFAARLGFEIEPSLWDAMVRYVKDIHRCSKARVLEEIYRLLRGGASSASFQMMEECGLLRELLPQLDTHLKKARVDKRDGDRVFWEYLDVLDLKRAAREELGNPLLLGALAVHVVGAVPGRNDLDQRPPAELADAVETLTRDWVQRLGVARRDRERLAHMLRSQPRFLRPRGRRFRPRAFVTKHYYPDSEALFALGCRATGTELETLARWQAIAAGEQVEAAPEPSRRSRNGGGQRSRSGRGRRRRRRRR